MDAGKTVRWWKARARELKTHADALYLAARHPGTPWYAKAVAALVVAYAFSPIDLIPDPIPVLGYLDDLLLLPLGFLLARRLVPPDVWEECVARARDGVGERPRSWAAAAVIVLLWVGALVLAARALAPLAARWR
ncbi:MAG TPA: DUF1232 domain-containing protein [Longimicrobiaceae bacterium]|nr:DUF1232 domain-containing protein [Longimicrobiaceae bacterium]